MALAVVRRTRMPSHAQPRRETSRRDLLARAPRTADLGDPSLPASGAVTDRSRIVHRGSAGHEACDILSHGETERPFVFADLCRRLALTHSARRRQRPPNSGHRRKLRSIDRLSTAPSCPRSCYRPDGRSGDPFCVVGNVTSMLLLLLRPRGCLCRRCPVMAAPAGDSVVRR
jgi:hypothetical protein